MVLGDPGKVSGMFFVTTGGGSATGIQRQRPRAPKCPIRHRISPYNKEWSDPKCQLRNPAPSKRPYGSNTILIHTQLWGNRVRRCYRAFPRPSGTLPNRAVTQEMRCGATSTSALPKSWRDYRKNAEPPGHNARPPSPRSSLPKHALSAPHTPVSHPALPQPVLIFRQTCVSTMAGWPLTSPLLGMLPVSINKNSPWSQGPREPGSPFSLWTLFPKAWEPKKLDSTGASEWAGSYEDLGGGKPPPGRSVWKDRI